MRVKNTDGRIQRRKNTFFLHLLIILAAIALIAASTVFVYKIIYNKIHNSDSVAALYDNWEKQDYQKVYDISSRILSKKPLQNTARTFHGYSAFFLAESSTDISRSQELLDEAISSLRMALQSAKEDLRPQIEYMIGKSYYYKDHAANYHYYADLTIKYLLLCRNHGYEAMDIAEYLGLSYAAIDEPQLSIESFTQALRLRESDSLLMNIAEQYVKNKQGGAAKAYLNRVVNTTKNEELELHGHVLLGQILLDEGDQDGAKKEFESILQKNENSADAHYGLGVLYEMKGDMAKARSEWRKCLRIQPNHLRAMQKISDGNL